MLEHTAQATVTVNDLGPTAAFNWDPSPQDEDGSTSIATLGVTVSPADSLVAALTGDTPLNEGQTGQFSAAGSTGSYDIGVLNAMYPSS